MGSVPQSEATIQTQGQNIPSPAGEPLVGSVPSRSAVEVALAIRQCVTLTKVDGEQVASISYNESRATWLIRQAMRGAKDDNYDRMYQCAKAGFGTLQAIADFVMHYEFKNGKTELGEEVLKLAASSAGAALAEKGVR